MVTERQLLDFGRNHITSVDVPAMQPGNLCVELDGGRDEVDVFLHSRRDTVGLAGDDLGTVVVLIYIVCSV